MEDNRSIVFWYEMLHSFVELVCNKMGVVVMGVTVVVWDLWDLWELSERGDC